MEANANPEMACNLGDTPASIAYSNNHTALSDWLENVTSSSKESGRVDSGLPPQDPLSSETNKDKHKCVQWLKETFKICRACVNKSMSMCNP